MYSNTRVEKKQNTLPRAVCLPLFGAHPFAVDIVHRAAVTASRRILGQSSVWMLEKAV